MESNYEGRTIFGASRAEERTAFVRSVYLWLMGGFGVAAVGALASPLVLNYLIGALGRFFFWPILGVYFGTFFWAQKVSRTKPQNRYAYAAFTFVAGIIAGMAMLAAMQQSGPGIVMAAMGMTAADFLVLSAVAHFSRKDFSFLGSFVTVGLVVAMVAILIGFFVQMEIFHLAISAVIVIACSAKILWDTSRMLQGGDYTDAAGFALSLFISLLNIFLNLLRLLSGGRRN
ncbi:Bax inhibitor-1 family protein [Geothrix sp. 21YS21S-2]|uniref:Bax inhibitor-1/YccA family protein n=1 Tax=Geothrix sp. 21YS21S-2 TaxID=3068893 RepID=UPI0027B92FDF|nr:Bax inhibitor-1 family protein [Geothrix sp. 21YS21S-2]